MLYGYYDQTNATQAYDNDVTIATVDDHFWDLSALAFALEILPLDKQNMIYDKFEKLCHLLAA